MLKTALLRSLTVPQRIVENTLKGMGPPFGGHLEKSLMGRDALWPISRFSLDFGRR